MSSIIIHYEVGSLVTVTLIAVLIYIWVRLSC